MSRFMFSVLILLVSVSAFAGSKPVSVPFSINSDGFVVVAATVGGSDAIHAILDTGAGLDVLAPSLIEKIHGMPAGHISVFRMNGERLDVPLFVIPELSVGPLVKKEVVVGSWDVLDKLSLAGIISIRDFRNDPITLDFVGKELIFETHRSLAKRRAEGKSSRLQLDDVRGVALDIFSSFLIGNQAGQCEIDTGSPNASVNTRYMPLMGIDRDSPGVHKQEKHSITGAPEVHYWTNVPEISLAAAPQLKLSPARVSFSNIIYDCVIGVDFWRDDLLTIDIADHQIIVTPPQTR